jgi:hypothetical protein
MSFCKNLKIDNFQVAALGDLSACGYTIAKHGMVSLTRSFK